MSLLKNVTHLFVLRIVSKVSMLGLIMYFTRQLRPEVLGEYFYFVSLLGIVGIFASLGTGGSAEKLISEENSESFWFSTGLYLTISLSAITGIVFIVLNSVVQLINPSLILYVISGLLVKRIYSYYQHVFRAELRASINGFVTVARNLLFGLFSLGFLAFGWGAEGLIIAEIISIASMIPVSAFLTRSTLEVGFPSAESMYELLDYGKFYIVSVVGSKINYFADIVFIGILLSKADVGKYEVAWRMILAGMFLNGIIARTAFSYFSKAESEGNLEQVKQHVGQIFEYVFMIPIATIAGATVLGPEFLGVLFSQEYAVGKSLLIILSFGFLFQSSYYLFNRILYGIDEPRQAFIAATIGILANIVLNPLLISLYGLVGAALATSLSYLIATLTYYYSVRNHIRVNIPEGKITTQVLAAVSMAGFVFLLKSVFTPGSIGILLLVGGGAALYFLILTAVPTTRESLLRFR